MKRVRILLALTIMLMIAMPAAAAQQQQQKKKRRAGQLSPTTRVMMTMTKLRSAWKELDLTAEQEAKAAKVREALDPKMKQVFEKLQEEILTDEQTEAIKEAAEKAQAAGKKDRALFQAIESSIKLTDEQKEKKAKVDKQLLKLQRQMMKQLRGILTPEQKETLNKKMWPKRKKAAKKKAA
jgi:hypothetical protein